MLYGKVLNIRTMGVIPRNIFPIHLIIQQVTDSYQYISYYTYCKNCVNFFWRVNLVI